jgi:DNA-directed RNA polymerase subunit RPC12/RpoP
MICPKCEKPVTSEQADEATIGDNTYPVYDCPCGYHLIVTPERILTLRNLMTGVGHFPLNLGHFLDEEKAN